MFRLLRYIYHKLSRKRRDSFIQDLVSKGLSLGKNVDIVGSFFIDPDHCFLISIGDNANIAPNVQLIAHDASTKNYLGFSKIARIEIGHDCFIGQSVIVLPGVKIGARSIIGAGSVVTRDIPAGSVAAGNPAKVICRTGEYLEKIKEDAASKRIFGEDYHIGNLTPEKRQELLDAVEDRAGYID